MKKTILTIAAVGVIALAGCSGSNGTLVKSNAGSVTTEDVYEQIKQTDQGKQIVKDLVEKQILGKKYKVTDKEIDKEIKDIRDELGYSEAQFKEAIPQFGYGSEKELREDMKSRILMIKVIRDGKAFTEDELKKEYDNMKKNNFNYKITASHILVEDEQKANELKAQLDGGADFATLATENSIDPGSAEKGGSLDSFTKGTLVKEFEDVAFGMKEGEISAPVKSQFGYHIIKLEKKEELSYDKMKNNLKNELLLKSAKPYDDPMEKYKKEVEKLEKEANIKVKDEDLKELFETKETKETKK
ncbi:peptidylprolyl isomerase [Massilibacterium senegalense]|uniref:peptidylprolyl isomerase n=1 Tax=Massilibacterium senegalense TaxID=1632858 RepID=UPI0007825C95|nr:peptidylprolyl isomerase [Massilibacterium senegalense]